jgi:SSS family transporter
MSVPAKAYMTNWEYLLGYPIIFLTAILVIYLILPFFRQIDATSAYEYLDKRFNRGARYLGSGFFILFQIGRMAIVMFLSALALAAITPFSAAQCILIMGVLSIIYSTLGGVEAVIWTDTLQTFVLLGGAILIFILVIFKLDGGMGEFVRIASEDDKFRMVNWDWDIFSYTTAAFWVIIIGALGQNLVSYGSDQAVVQRYMTTSDTKKAAKSILTNGIMSVPAGLLFFAVGTALYVFYKSHPAGIDPNFQNDAVMPLFIVEEVPAGLAGLIIAGIFAAAQSTISTSMNSISTAMVTDFVRPMKIIKTEKAYLNTARILTVVFGTAGTGLAITFASADIKSLLDQFFAVLGLFGGALGGLFLLGMFTKRANGKGAVAGALIGAVVLFLVSRYTETHVYLYAAIGIAATMSSGWLISLLMPGSSRDIAGLTVYDLRRGKNKSG